MPGLSKDVYYGRDAKHSGLFTLSAEYDLHKNISIRPEIAFLSRGGKQYMYNIGHTKNGVYSLKANYFDVRVPLIYNIRLSRSKILPYAYVAPLLGFVTGGKVSLNEKLWNGLRQDYMLRLTQGNMAAAYFAVVVGAGVKYPINISGFRFNVGLEFSYEYGITDTYSKKERVNESISINGIDGPVMSRRKFSGFELKTAIQIPLSSFKRKKREKPVHIEEPVPVVDTPKEKPCYTLQEIQELIAKGDNVTGKTICSVDDIRFDTAKSTIKAESSAYLRQVAKVVIETGIHVIVKGHTDNTGTDEFNLKLSKNRAMSVVNYLINLGVDRSKITYSYYGESRPLDTNDTEEGRRLNRRVEFELIKK